MNTIKQLFFMLGTTTLLFSCGQETKNEKTVNKKSDTLEINTPTNATLENLSTSLINALKENHYSIIEDMLPLKEDVENIVADYEGTQKEKEEILAGADENVKKISENTRIAFDDILKKGTEAGIIWTEVTFSNAEYATKKENNIEIAVVTIIFEHKTAIHKIKIEECIKTKKGWLIFDKPKWQE